MSRPLPRAVRAATGGDVEAVRAHILDAVYRVIVRDGLSGASTRAVAEEAGLAGGTLYNYFDNRTGMVAAAILQRVRVLTEPVSDLPARAGVGTVAGNLAAFADQAVGVLGELVPLFASTFAEPALLEEVRGRMGEVGMVADPAGAVERYLVAEREVGRVGVEADCRAAALIVVSLCHDDAFQGYLHGVGDRRRDRVREIGLVAKAVAGSAEVKEG